MGGLSFLQRLTGKISNEDLKKLASKEHDEIMQLKQKNADIEAALKKAQEQQASAAKLAAEERQMQAMKKQIEDLNAKLMAANARVCPPCQTLDLDKVQLKDIPNVSEKFKTWIKSLPATTADRNKIIDQVNTLPESQRQAALPSKQTQSAFQGSSEAAPEPRSSARRASAPRQQPAPRSQYEEEFTGGARKSRKSRKASKTRKSRKASKRHSRVSRR